MTAVSAPVRSADGRIVAAISIVGPTFRLQGEVLARTRRAVLGTAARLAP
ncbi:MAG: IclR family transcriptional regulator C-terminal domain-containing protein [Actinomycetota bacterium]